MRAYPVDVRVGNLAACAAYFPVAAPLTWRDVERGIRSDAFSIQNPPGSRANRARKVRP
jgi:DNA primase